LLFFYRLYLLQMVSKSLVVVFLLAFSVVQSYGCSYIASNGISTYSFPSEWMNLTDSDNNIWFFNACPNSASLDSPCPNGVSVCYLRPSGEVVVAGITNTSLYSDSPDGAAEGVEVLLGSDTSCDDDSNANIKTAIELICTQDLEGDLTPFVVSPSPCTYVITAFPLSACPWESSVWDGSSFPQTSFIEREEYKMSRTLKVLIPTLMFLLAICCCIIRRRCHSINTVDPNYQLPMQFEAISHEAPFPGTLPTYSPFVNQPLQYVYYVPAPQQVPLQSEPLNIEDDQRYAIELQAIFDRERN